MLTPNVFMLLFAALLHEDVAILAAGFFIIEQGMSPALALAVLLGGVVSNSCAIYGFGAAARRLPWMQRWLIGAKVERIRRRLEKHLLPTVALCRFVPGTLSPTLLGCGWLRVPFARFTLIATVTAALYVPLMLALVMSLGVTLFQRLSEWAWLILLALLAIVAVVVVVREATGARSNGHSRAQTAPKLTSDNRN